MDEQELKKWEERFTRYIKDHSGSDGSHDAGHFRRVWNTAQQLRLNDCADANLLTLLASAYFHDIISLPKNDPDSYRSSQLSADAAALILRREFPDFPDHLIPEIQHAIHAHSFSAGVIPLTLEAKLLQDADRMEALGAIGIARVFYTAGRLGTRMFCDEDPEALNRIANDKKYALDHFKLKLLKLPAAMNTGAGKAMAAGRAAYLKAFLDEILGEIDGSS